MKSFIINADADETISLPSGTTIFIPSGTFVGPDGNPITGEYELLYREFHDAIDVLLSGIHMDFYSMGQKRTFQTAGMFHIDAKQGDQQLRIAEGKKIDVRFGSAYIGEDYNFFFLNPNTGGWEWVDLPEAEINQEKADALADLSKKKPALYMGDEYFVANFNNFLDIYLNNDWDKIYKLREDKKTRKYLEEYDVAFHNIDMFGEIVFGRAYYNPAEMLWKDLDGKKFPKWLKDFTTDWQKDQNNKWYIANYNLRSLGNNIYEVFYKFEKNTFTKKIEAVIPIKNLLKLPPKEWKKRYDDAMLQLAEEQAKIDLMAETFRSFSVGQLGVYNFDRLMKLDDWFEVVPTFTISDTPIENQDFIIVFGDNSGYVKYTPNEYSKLMINPESGHRIMMILPNNELALYPPELFKDMDIATLRSQSKPPVAFTLEKHTFTDAVSLREFLGF